MDEREAKKSIEFLAVTIAILLSLYGIASGDLIFFGGARRDMSYVVAGMPGRIFSLGVFMLLCLYAVKRFDKSILSDDRYSVYCRWTLYIGVFFVLFSSLFAF